MTAVADANQIRENNRKLWSAEVENWRKWYPFHKIRAKAATETLMGAAGIMSGMNVLDIASGSGQPALTIAEIVGPAGKVTATDLVPEMLSLAGENARKEDILNVEFKVAGVTDLPFSDETFDAVTCRFGVMFFPDVGGGLREVRRVLKSSGKAAFVAWGPKEQNQSWLFTIGIILKHAKLPAPEPYSSDPYSFAEPGKLAHALKKAGFDQVQEKTLTIDYPFPGAPEQAWESFSDTWKLMGVFNSVSSEDLDKIRKESIETMMKYYDGHRINTKASIVVGSGNKESRLPSLQA